MRLKRHDERGATSLVTFLVIIPVLLIVFLAGVGAWRYADTLSALDSVTYDAARAASLERNTSKSAAVAEQMVRDAIKEDNLVCRDLSVTTNVTSYVPGGFVSTTVACTADLGDLTLSGLPGEKRFELTAVVPIEEFRSR